MKVIVINGLPRSGKSTFVEFCKESDADVYNISTVDEVKEKAKLLGWDGVKDEPGRRFLSDLKDALTLYCDGPFRYVAEKIEAVKDNENALCFVHCREPKEIQRFVDEYNAKTLFIRRAAADDIVSNHADAQVYDFDYDFVYSNDGSLEKLARDAISFANWIIKK